MEGGLTIRKLSFLLTASAIGALVGAKYVKKAKPEIEDDDVTEIFEDEIQIEDPIQVEALSNESLSESDSLDSQVHLINEYEEIISYKDLKKLKREIATRHLKGIAQDDEQSVSEATTLRFKKLEHPKVPDP